MKISKLLLIFAVIVCLISPMTLAGCENTGEYIIELEVDKTAIKADGNDKILLSATVTTRSGRVIETDEVEFYEGKNLIVYPEYRTRESGRHTIVAKYKGCVSNEVLIRAVEKNVYEIKVEANKLNIKSNSGDKIRFTAEGFNQNGNSIGSDSNIKIYSGDNVLDDGIFESSESGVYFISAKYKEETESNKIAVSVSDSDLIDEGYTLELEGKTTFLLGTSKSISLKGTLYDKDGNKVKDREIEYFSDGKLLNENKFTADSEGKYTVYAMCEGLVSNSLTITVRKPEFIDAESTNLPVLVINTDGKNINNDNKITATMTVYDNESGKNSINDEPALITDISIRLRGQSSLTFPKKQYGIELKDSNGEDTSYPLLGMDKEEDWVLNGSYADKSLLRNYIAYSFGRLACEYAPDTRFCEVYINDSNDSENPYNYMGIYLLIEKIKIDDGRVDIDKLDTSITGGDDITGGYIVARDKIKEGEASINTAQGSFSFVSPKYEKMNQEQIDYITNYMNNFVNALFGSNYQDYATGYARYLDLESYATVLLINELTKNIDGMDISLYYYKPRNEKLHAGPVWDFDLSMGNVDYRTGTDPEGWYCVSLNAFPRRIMTDNAFVIMFRAKWKELRENVFSDENIDKIIDDALNYINCGALERSLERWPGQWNGMFVWPNPSYGDERYTSSYEEEVEYLRYFLHTRAQWIDDNIMGKIDLEPVFYDWIDENTGERRP